MIKTTEQLAQEEETTLAPYAMKSAQSSGRVHNEPQDPYRTPFQRDRDRIIHCRAFRRLQAKTQVFVSYYGDHYRDRLTHSLEVAQIARDLSRTLGLNEDLSECLALAHDLGHPPFGHGGEEALNKAMQKHGLHFEHNEQSRRIVEELEKNHQGFDGLNLTKEVLDGLLKHNPHEYHTYTNFKVSSHLEAQIMDAADEIAYFSHDVDDGFRAGIITLKQLQELDIWREAEKAVRQKMDYPLTPPPPLIPTQSSLSNRFTARITSRLMSHMINDLQENTAKNLAQHNIDSLQKVRDYPKKLVEFSPAMAEKLAQLRGFLMDNFYTHPEVAQHIEKGKKIIQALFDLYYKDPAKLPEPFQQQIAAGTKAAIVVKDYVSGMTDHYAEQKYDALSKM